MMHPHPSTPERGPRPLRQRAALLSALLLPLALGMLLAPPVRAEYRAYELEVVDRFNCALQKQNPCQAAIITSSLPPDMYARMNGGADRISVQLRATWMCYGDTSNFDPVCPRPPARQPKYNQGDGVQVRLEKHITNGWQGVVEIAYYQDSIRSNVYGVRFPDRGNVYARYFEKDLVPLAQQPENTTAPQANAAPGAAQAGSGQQGPPAAPAGP